MKIDAELIGLLATGFVLISFLTTGEKNIRRINIVGALLFVAYGYFIQSFSVSLLNGALFIIHVYKLTILGRSKK